VPEATVVHDYEFEKGPDKLFLLERNRGWAQLANLSAPALVLLAPLLLATEAGMALVALRGGWWSQKTAAWRALWATRQGLRRWRAQVQSLRRAGDAELLAQHVGRLDTPLVQIPARRLVGRVLETYRRAVVGLLLLLSIPYYAPAYAFGGSVTVAETIVGGLLDAGHDVTVLTTDVLDERTRIALDAPPIPAGATVVRFPNVSHRLATANAYLPRGARRWLREHVGEYDVVLLQDLYSAVSVWSARAASGAGVPYVLQPLGTASPARERGRSVAKQAFLTAWGGRTVREASTVLHSTDHEADELRAIGARDEQLMRMPLPLELPVQDGAGRSSHPTVAYVGRLHAIKRIDVLIEAVALVRRSVPDLTLEVVGPGKRHEQELRGHAARLGAGDAVRFHGYVSNEEKLRMLGAAHVSALLSAGEGLPMAALEAMALGTPVVLSEGCHFPEVDGRAGIVVGGSAQDAAAALERLLGDAGLRERLGEGARALAAEYRREAVMPRMAEALEGLALASTS
jgi:glycosyltransferase involved in cell wall biosynthesis